MMRCPIQRLICVPLYRISSYNARCKTHKQRLFNKHTVYFSHVEMDHKDRKDELEDENDLNKMKNKRN